MTPGARSLSCTRPLLGPLGRGNASVPHGDEPYGTGATHVPAADYWFCGGSAAMNAWSRSIKPSLEAPPGDPRSSKNSTFAL